MIRTRFVTLLAGILTMLLLVAHQSVFAQHERGNMSGMSKDTTGQHGMMMSHQMMQQMEQDNRSTEAALKEIRAAKSSDDPKELHSVLDKAEKALTQVHQHMKSHMSMIKQMHEGGTMQGGGDMMQHNMKDGMKDSMKNMPMDSTHMQK